MASKPKTEPRTRLNFPIAKSVRDKLNKAADREGVTQKVLAARAIADWLEWRAK